MANTRVENPKVHTHTQTTPAHTMEDDDEFGDLYTDVLRPLTTSSAPQPPPVQSAATSLSRSIDLHIQSDEEEVLYGAPESNQLNFNSSQQSQRTLVSDPETIVAWSSDSHRTLNQEVDKEEGLTVAGKSLDASDLPARVLESGGEVKEQEKGFEDPKVMDEAGIDVVFDERDDKDDVLVNKNEILVERSENFEKFDIEDVNNGIGEPMIPGVLDSTDNRGNEDLTTRAEVSDDWDSDSEDDLQIVLNDNNHGLMVMGVDDEDEDEDEEPLVIVADSIPNHHQVEEQDWGEDASQAVDRERKELGETLKVNGGVAQQPKIAYSSHGYHPFHSQFKYVRPGAAPVVPGGTPGQLRPHVNVGPIAGCGRGDWRPTGIKCAPPTQKSFHPGYGMPVWGNNASGRGFGSGMEFTLPSYKTIFEVDIDSFEQKPWRLQGIDISDFFNFGLNEETWKDYCKQLEQLRLETTMQRKIRVYESGRTEQEYDPDMPPELAAAAAIHDVSSENANIGKTDDGQSDLAKGSACVQSQLPTGRAIQVETGYGERLPSIDTRPPRIRDSDAIIEIVLQDSADDDSLPRNDNAELPDNDPSREDLSGGHEIAEDTTQKDAKHFDSMPQVYNDRKRELIGRRAPLKNSVHDNITEGDRISPFVSEAPIQYHPNSSAQTSVYTGRNSSVPCNERWTKGRASDKSPKMTPNETTQDKRFLDNQKEESVESVDGKQSPHLASPATVGITEEGGFEHKVDLVLADGSSELEREETAFDTTTTTETLKDGSLMQSVKKQKLSSQVKPPSLQEIDDEDLKAARSSENSKARSGSSGDYQNLRHIEEEVLQDRRSTRTKIIKRPIGKDEHIFLNKGRDERQEMERHRMTIKGREDLYYRKNWESNCAPHLHMNTMSIDKRKEVDNYDGTWQRRGENPHGRRTRSEDTRKRERGDEMESRQRSKVRENERSDKDEHQLKKQLDNGSWRGHHEKDTGSRHRDRDDNLKTRNENLDDLHGKRRKEDVQLRRDPAEKEENLHIHRENTSHRKRGRDDILDRLPNKKDVLDHQKRYDQARLRNDDQHSVRHREEGLFQREKVDKQRERNEWHGLKQAREESLSKREREGRGGVRSERAAEDKAWVSHSRVKDEYKGSDRGYHFKDTGRHSEQLKRRDRAESESLSWHRGSEDVYARRNQLNNDDRRSRQERASSRSDRAVNASDNQRVHEKRHKENTGNSKESEDDHSSWVPSRRNQGDHSGQISDWVGLRGMIEQRGSEHEISMNRQSFRKHKEDASSDEEQQDSRRGRSKLERWTSHKERDFNIGTTKSSSSLDVKEMHGYKDGESSLTRKIPDEHSKTVETVENPHHLVDEKDGDLEIKNVDVDVKPTEDRHLDMDEKLKKRSERFKLPMLSEKEGMAIRKMESEPFPSAQTETLTDSEIKHERPVRKRRWTSN